MNGQLTIDVAHGTNGLLLTVRGHLGVPAAAELERYLLLEASMQPSWVILDLTYVDDFDPWVSACVPRWVQAFDDVESRLLVRGADVDA